MKVLLALLIALVGHMALAAQPSLNHCLEDYNYTHEGWVECALENGQTADRVEEVSRIAIDLNQNAGIISMLLEGLGRIKTLEVASIFMADGLTTDRESFYKAYRCVGELRRLGWADAAANKQFHYMESRCPSVYAYIQVNWR